MKLPIGTEAGWMGSKIKGVVIAYFDAVRTPTEYNLNPESETFVVLDLGDNGFWSDTGSPFVTMMVVHTDNLTNIWDEHHDEWAFDLS